MNIVKVLRAEEIRLESQLLAVRRAIRVLDGKTGSAFTSRALGPRNGRTFSAAARARMSRKAKERWAKWRAKAAVSR